MSDFWVSCGHHLLDRDAGGGLIVTDEFLKAYLARPELKPPPEACEAERALHASLLAQPRRPVQPAEIAALADPDARENWELVLGFRDHLLAHPTIEGAYVTLARKGAGRMPPLFLNQLVHVILRNVLDGCSDAHVVRAAELFFRPQIVTLHEGSLLAADDELISGTNPGPVSPLVSMLGLKNAANIDVLVDDSAGSYWERSDQFDMAIDLTAGRRGIAALGEVIQRWVAHLLGTEVDVEPLIEVRDASFTWYVGLDAEGTKIGNALWHGAELDDQTRERVVGLYRLTFRDPTMVLDKVRGEPVYLILAVDADKHLRLKPQNLIAGLPVRHMEEVT